MGETSPLKIGVARPRPLGLVKRESIHFEDVEASGDFGLPAFPGKHLTWSPSTLVELGRSKTESDIKRDLKSMRDLQETLRQAALLNIVAAVNHDDRPVDSLPLAARVGGSQSVGIKGASILGHTIPTPASKLLVSTGSSNEVLNIGHFSHNLQSSSYGIPNSMTPGTQTSTVNQILAQRTRTISIPRPRTQSDQASFMHRSLLDAKEMLTGITTFRAGLGKEDNHFPSQDTARAASIKEHPAGERSDIQQSDIVESKQKDLVRTVSCIRGTGLETSESGHQDKSTKDTTGHNNQNGDSMSKDELRAHNVHQMQAVKRHISTSKKKEMMKKLTDIAKCDAVDIATPFTSFDANAAPPIIIMSQQKEPCPNMEDVYDSRVNRAKSMTSLSERGEEHRVPSNTRVQSETIDALLNHREAKKMASLKVEEDLIIESLNGPDRQNNGVDGLYRTYRDLRITPMGALSPSNPLSQEPFFIENVVGRSTQPSDSPDFLELRPLEGSPIIHNRAMLNERRRPHVSRRPLALPTRDKLASPSPVVYEASFHRPKASMGQISLVGQSVQSVSELNKINQQTPSKPQQPKGDGNIEESSLLKKPLSDTKTMSLKHWGSTAKPPTKSPILRTEILDHLQCVGLVNHRPLNNPNFYKKYNFKSSSIFDGADLDRSEEDIFNDDNDDASSSGTPVAVKKTPQYRKSKLYNAFRASEENLSNLVDASCIETETMTGRSLLNQKDTAAPVPSKKAASPPPSRDPVQIASKEPLYMGCSSRVSENDLRSQFHYVSEADEKDAGKGTNFKVMKAIDQDVYFDFQHKKYRKNTDSPMNTAADKPRMHFLKIKFNGEEKT